MQMIFISKPLSRKICAIVCIMLKAAMHFNEEADPGIFFTIRNAFTQVAEQARHVYINYKKIDSFAKMLRPLPVTKIFDREHHFIGTDEQTAAFVLILDSVNFGGPLKKDLAAEGLCLEDNSLYFWS